MKISGWGSVCLALLLTGCAAVVTPVDEEYQFGATTGSLFDLRDAYCEEADPHRRAVILALMYRAGVTLPPNGACTSILEALDADRDTEALTD